MTYVVTPACVSTAVNLQPQAKSRSNVIGISIDNHKVHSGGQVIPTTVPFALMKKIRPWFSHTRRCWRKYKWNARSLCYSAVTSGDACVKTHLPPGNSTIYCDGTSSSPQCRDVQRITFVVSHVPVSSTKVHPYRHHQQNRGQRASSPDQLRWYSRGLLHSKQQWHCSFTHLLALRRDRIVGEATQVDCI